MSPLPCVATTYETYKTLRHRRERLLESTDLVGHLLVAVRLRPHVLQRTDLYVPVVQTHLAAHGQVGVVAQSATSEKKTTLPHQVLLGHRLRTVAVEAVRCNVLPELVRTDRLLHLHLLTLLLRHGVFLSLVLANVDLLLLVKTRRTASQLG